MFTPYSKSLDGSNKPSMEELARLGFNDVNTAVAGALVSIENVIHSDTRVTLAQLKKEMKSMKSEIVEEAKNYADMVQAQTEKSFTTKMQKLRASIITTIQAAEETEQKGTSSTMDLSN